ncbi:MAG: TlpA family protein disulfide reductase [Gemmatimonadetes bacterium]|nr:TlpA family protein disulfide reductase [Gemmatimonadota bacterium]
MLSPGDLAPSPTLRSLAGERHALGVDDGPRLIAFVEVDCPTCRLTLPYLNRLAGLLGERCERLVLVSQDGPEETRALVARYELAVPVLLDEALEASRAFDPPSVPALFLVGADGRIGSAHVGFHKADLNATAGALLASLGLSATPVADAHDGAPESKPGCASRHLSIATATGGAASPEPLDLRPERGARASRIEVSDSEDAYEYCIRAGFSGFLPVVPPTVDRVEAFVAAAGLAPERVIGLVPPCYGAATVEKIAANAVMAGCGPEHMEVLIPIVRAACDERFNLHGVQATTNSATPLVILSGPAAARLGFVSGAGVFGNVARANSTVGRALQLIMANLGGARPGEIDMATLAHPGRFSYCIAENHAASPWEPLHVDLGFAPDESTVTLFAAAAPMEVSEHTARKAEGVLRTIAATLSVVFSWRRCGRVDAVVVVCPEHAATIAADGFSKRDARDFLFENTGVPLRAFEHEGTEGTQSRDGLTEVLIDGERHYRKFADPYQIQLVVAGGTAGKFSAVIGGWLAGPKGSESVTYPIRKEMR